MKKLEIHIMHCNSNCPNFYHNFDDCENIWCTKLNKKVYDEDGSPCVWFDHIERPIPDGCPLEDV
jgi:hypothetical protein